MWSKEGLGGLAGCSRRESRAKEVCNAQGSYLLIEVKLITVLLCKRPEDGGNARVSTLFQQSAWQEICQEMRWDKQSALRATDTCSSVNRAGWWSEICLQKQFAIPGNNLPPKHLAMEVDSNKSTAMTITARGSSKPGLVIGTH